MTLLILLNYVFYKNEEGFLIKVFNRIFQVVRPRSHGNVIVPLRSDVLKSGKLKGCVQTGTLQIEPFQSKKLNDQKFDTKNGTIRNRSFPFPSEHPN